MTDKNTLDLARQWAADIDADRETLSQDTIDAAADLISSLPESWVGADTLRRYIADWREGLATAPRGNYEGEMLDDLEALLPAPPTPRTMDEIEWDDAEHHLAEASVAAEKLDGNISETVIMLGVNRFGNISALDTSTWAAWALSKDTLTPTGRKYRLEPEDDTRTGAESENISHGQPEPQSGEAWLIDIDGEQTVALLGKVDPADDEPTWFTDDGCGYSRDSGNPVARLVPETTEQDPPADHAETEVTDD